VSSRAYDLVLNGSRSAGGSIRIHQRALQERIFRNARHGRASYEEKFGFLLSALDSGRRPTAALPSGSTGWPCCSAVIFHPGTYRISKTQKASCLLTNAPFRAGVGPAG